MPNPWVSPSDQLIPVNKTVKEKGKIGERTGGGGKKHNTRQFSKRAFRVCLHKQ
jgi:hypothetical protein